MENQCERKPKRKKEQTPAEPTKKSKPNQNRDEKPLRGRVYTKDLPVEKRRMDSLADLLAAHSECVAVAVVDGRLLITANELHKGSRNNETSRAIETVANYFKTLSTPKTAGKSPEQADRKEMFKTICSHKKMNDLARGGHLIISEKLLSDTVEQVLDHVEDNKSLRVVMHEKRSEAAAFGLVYGKCIELYSDFDRMEKSIQQAISSPGPSVSSSSSSSSDSKALHPAQIKALQQFDAKRDILEEEPKEKESKGVHAEMQILNHLLDTVVKDRLTAKNKKNPSKLGNLEIYIGISKLCCTQCHCMIQAANELFKREGIKVSLKVRGTHGLDFNWNCPSKFKAGYSGKGPTGKSLSGINGIAYDIGKSGRDKIDDELEKEHPHHVSLLASQTDSDTESVADQPFTEQLAKLKGHQESLKLFPPEEKLALGKIAIAIKLYEEVPAFKVAWEQVEKRLIAEDGSVDHLAIQEEYNERIEEIQENVLLEILHDERLVGKEMSEIFQQKGKSDVEEIMSSFSSPSSSSSSDSSLSSGAPRSPLPRTDTPPSGVGSGASFFSPSAPITRTAASSASSSSSASRNESDNPRRRRTGGDMSSAGKNAIRRSSKRK